MLFTKLFFFQTIRYFIISGGAFLILNRWGNKVKVLNSLYPEWDGIEASDGVYFYIFKSEERQIIKQGFISIIR